MKSADLSNIAPWNPWSEITVQHAPSAPGVYVFRMAGGQVVGRFKGQSDIVYIGTTAATRGSLRKRLAQHLVAREDQTGVGARIGRALQEVGPLEIGWVTCSDSREACRLESEALSTYYADHLELPPLNRKEPGIRLRRVLRLIDLLPDHERREVLAKL